MKGRLKVKRVLAVLLMLLMVASTALTAVAHSGRTDANGGHYDNSTGGYHYHHGYPAHQHENGICPYDYDDKTGENSGSDGNSITSESATYQIATATSSDSRATSSGTSRAIVDCRIILIVIFTIANLFSIYKSMDVSAMEDNFWLRVLPPFITAALACLLYLNLLFELSMMLFLPPLLAVQGKKAAEKSIHQQAQSFRISRMDELKKASIVVYCTKGGKKYHVDSACSALRNARTPVLSKKECDVSPNQMPCQRCSKDPQRITYHQREKELQNIPDDMLLLQAGIKPKTHPCLDWLLNWYWDVLLIVFQTCALVTLLCLPLSIQFVATASDNHRFAVALNWTFSGVVLGLSVSRLVAGHKETFKSRFKVFGLFAKRVGKTVSGFFQTCIRWMKAVSRFFQPFIRWIKSLDWELFSVLLAIFIPVSILLLLFIASFLIR